MNRGALYLRRILVGAILSCVAAVSLCSCSTSGCNDNRSSLPLAKFYAAGSNQAISLDSIRIYGVGVAGDSMLVESGIKASQTYLPLRPNHPDVSFDIEYTQSDLAEMGISDRLSIYYTTIPYFASEECGAMYRYRITAIQHTNMILDSVAVVPVDSVITNIDVESIKLFFRVSEQ